MRNRAIFALLSMAAFSAFGQEQETGLPIRVLEPNVPGARPIAPPPPIMDPPIRTERPEQDLDGRVPNPRDWDGRSFPTSREITILRGMPRGDWPPNPASAAGEAAIGTPLVHEIVVAAPVANVWRSWSTSTGLSGWLAPLATIELRPGGTLRVSYDGSGVDSATAVVNEILSFDPQRMLSFRVARAPSNFPHAAAVSAMWTVVYLEPVSATATRVRAVVNGLGDDEAGQNARAFFEAGNAETLRRLAERFGTPQQ